MATDPKSERPTSNRSEPPGRYVLRGYEFLGALVEAGIVPRTAQRVVIDAAVGELVKVYVEQVGERDWLRVLASPDLAGAVVLTSGTPVVTPPEGAAADGGDDGER